ACGTKESIITSIRELPEEEPLPMKPYAIEGYCPRCAGDEAEPKTGELFGSEVILAEEEIQHDCSIAKNNGKFYKRMSAPDLARYQTASHIWNATRERLPYPKQEIPDGQE